MLDQVGDLRVRQGRQLGELLDHPDACLPERFADLCLGDGTA